MPRSTTPDSSTNGYRYILGAGFEKVLDAPVLTLGKSVWTRRTIATELGLATPMAARKFGALCHDLGIKTPADLYKKSPIDLADYRGCGVTTLYVAIRILEHAGLDVNAWYEGNQPENHVTFYTLKHRAANPERAAAARTATKAKATKRT
jgi:hypothetical protein